MVTGLQRALQGEGGLRGELLKETGPEGRVQATSHLCGVVRTWGWGVGNGEVGVGGSLDLLLLLL